MLSAVLKVLYSQAIRQRSRVIPLQAGEVFRLRGPGGTITLHDGGITLDGIAAYFGEVEH